MYLLMCLKCVWWDAFNTSEHSEVIFYFKSCTTCSIDVAFLMIFETLKSVTCSLHRLERTLRIKSK